MANSSLKKRKSAVGEAKEAVNVLGLLPIHSDYTYELRKQIDKFSMPGREEEEAQLLLKKFSEGR